MLIIKYRREQTSKGVEDSVAAYILQCSQYIIEALQQRRGGKEALTKAYGCIAPYCHTNKPKKTNLKMMEKVITMQYAIRKNYYWKQRSFFVHFVQAYEV